MQKFRFEGLSLTVESIDRSIDFYVTKLGLNVAYNAPPTSR
jgi:catechol 2,3-dioxygenase-like lactoylglutathione lyase family enzyme